MAKVRAGSRASPLNNRQGCNAEGWELGGGSVPAPWKQAGPQCCKAESWGEGQEKSLPFAIVLHRDKAHSERQSCCDNRDYLLGISLVSLTRMTYRACTSASVARELACRQNACSPSSWKPCTLTHPFRTCWESLIFPGTQCGDAGGSRSMPRLELVQEVPPAVL